MKIFNASWSHGYVSQFLKMAKMINVLKKGKDISTFLGYQPITLVIMQWRRTTESIITSEKD
ncbi:hypothetical protein DPMN_084806 [Dreissena polymorpha]|uniref:Uncharacterized protein n=1 Tax=Dreissena polymorpha TaxID=45954 RepID=A0A9D3YBG6_DREPO|nr:hypothetical protein DPMN_084806 [Dreissena polymorpha]